MRSDATRFSMNLDMDIDSISRALIGPSARRKLRAVLMSSVMLSCVGAAVAQDAAMPPKAQICISCHGAGGNSTVATIPNLASQPKQFLVAALYMFREGNRKSEQMSPFAASLTNADMNELGAYFSAQKLDAPKAKLTAAQTETGVTLTQKNNCVACHASTLGGQQHIPRLAGQQYTYVKAQLTAFHASTRYDPDGAMTSAAQALSEQDIEALSVYVAGLSAAPIATAK